MTVEIGNPAGTDAPDAEVVTVAAWARSQGWAVPPPCATGRIRFTAPDGAFVVAWHPAGRTADVIAALRRYGLVWPPPARRRRGGARR
jgi:hypothetical protein